MLHRVCPQCATDNAAEAPLRYSFERWHIKRCRSCGFVYMEQAYPSAGLAEAQAWEKTTLQEDVRRQAIRPLSYGVSKRTRWRMRFQKRGKMDHLIQRHGRPGNLIDLGCGDGGGLKRLPEGVVPYGVEVSRALAERAQVRFAARGGGAINAASLDGLARFEAGFFSMATLRSYLEHETEPKAVLRALHRVLAPGSVAIVKVPNYASWNRVVMGRRWCGFRYPDHQNYFTPASLRAMAEDCGYAVGAGFGDQLVTNDNMYAILTRR